MADQVLRMNGRLPGLYIPYPQCDHCGRDVTIEDSIASCDTCLIQWDEVQEDRESTPDPNRDGTEVPCHIVDGKQGDPHVDKHGHQYTPGPPLPCILPSGHEGYHLCPYDVEVTRALVSEGV